MKKKICACLGVWILLLAMSACGKSGTSAVIHEITSGSETVIHETAAASTSAVMETKPDTSAAETTTEPKSSEAAESEVNHAADFVGEWEDTFSMRCHMTIECDDGIYYSIEINWAASAFENYRWVLTGTYDEEEEGIVYMGGCIYEDYSGDEVMTETLYKFGEGVIYIGRKGMLYWEDYLEDAGADCVFEKLDYEEENEGTASSDSVEFITDWYKTYRLFLSEDDSFLQMSWLDGGIICIEINGSDIFEVLEYDYTRAADGAYVYPDMMGEAENGGEVRYYPENGNYVEIDWQGETTRYYYYGNR